MQVVHNALRDFIRRLDDPIIISGDIRTIIRQLGGIMLELVVLVGGVLLLWRLAKAFLWVLIGGG